MAIDLFSKDQNRVNYVMATQYIASEKWKPAVVVTSFQWTPLSLYLCTRDWSLILDLILATVSLYHTHIYLIFVLTLLIATCSSSLLMPPSQCFPIRRLPYIAAASGIHDPYVVISTSDDYGSVLPRDRLLRNKLLRTNYEVHPKNLKIVEETVIYGHEFKRLEKLKYICAKIKNIFHLKSM